MMRAGHFLRDLEGRINSVLREDGRYRGRDNALGWEVRLRSGMRTPQILFPYGFMIALFLASALFSFNVGAILVFGLAESTRVNIRKMACGVNLLGVDPVCSYTSFWVSYLVEYIAFAAVFSYVVGLVISLKRRS
jgi:hypothetical protein